MSLERKKRQKKQPRTTYSIAFSNFAGDQVVFLLRSVKGRSGDQILNLSMEGYLLDECEDFYYFGVTPEEVTGVIRRSDVVTMVKGSYSLNTGDFEIPEGTEVQ